MLSNLFADVRYAIRGLSLSPMFAVVIVLTLAFGIGVNSAVLSLFEQAILRPLPVAEPEALVNLVSPGEKAGGMSCDAAGNCASVFSYPMFRELERVQEPFVGIAAHRLLDVNVALDGDTSSGRVLLVSGSYFPLLGIAPSFGRLLDPQDDRAGGGAETAVLSHDYWQNRLGADPAVLGRIVIVNGQPLEVVGIAPQGFHGTTLGERPAAFVPITFRAPQRVAWLPELDDVTAWLYLFARLKPGTSAELAATSITAPYRAILNDVELPLARGLSAQDIEEVRGKSITLAPGARGQSVFPNQSRAPLTAVLVVTGIVLLIACVNIANLMLTRGATRVGEMAVRASLGAAPRRLLSLLIVEALLLAALAAAVSVPLTLLTLRGIELLLANDPQVQSLDFALDGRAVGFGASIALASVLVFGLFPALKLARTQPGAALQSYGSRSTGGKAVARFRAALATTQIALSMALLVMAGLFTQSLLNVARIDLGIRTESLLAFTVSPELNGYTPERSAVLFDALETELAAVPGVTDVGSAMVPLLANSNWGGGVYVEGFGAAEDDEVLFNLVGSGFFRTVGVPLLAGRDFTSADSRDRPRVAIVNERFANRFGLGRDAIGKRLGLGSDGLDVEIVGVVRDAKYSTVKGETPPQLFTPRRAATFQIRDMTFYVRAAQDPAQMLGAIPAVVAKLDPTLPVDDLRTVDQQVRENVSDDRLVTMLATALAVLATLLAALGLYGVLSYTVAQRTREIGLRIALGAPPRQLRAMVLRRVAWMGTVGGAIGLAVAVLLGQVAAGLLFGLQPTDPPTLLGAAAVLGLVVLGAGYLPARRASRIDPIVALRVE